MDLIFQLLLVLLPAGAVFGISYFFMNKYFETQTKRENLKLRRESVRSTDPARIAAYERMVLFLERVNPSALAMRLQSQSKSSDMLRKEMVENIKTEYEHNIAQQLYLSEGAWKLIKRAKEESIRIINIGATQVIENNPQSNGTDLAKHILSMSTQVAELPTEVALRGVIREFQANYS